MTPQQIQEALAVWFELAPGELPSDLVYSDEDLVANITEPIMGILNTTSFFVTLDEVFTRAENSAVCWDFRVAKSILPTMGFLESDPLTSSAFLRLQGGYCDCEILYNIAEGSEFARRYWANRQSLPKQK